jgi:hypothetical protein
MHSAIHSFKIYVGKDTGNNTPTNITTIIIMIEE